MDAYEKCMDILSSHELEDLLIDGKVDMGCFWTAGMEALGCVEYEDGFLNEISSAMDSFGVQEAYRKNLSDNIAFLFFSLLKTNGDLDLGRMVNDLPGFILFSAIYALLDDHAEEDREKSIHWYYLLRTMHLFLFKEEKDAETASSIMAISTIIMKDLFCHKEWRRIREIGMDTVYLAEDWMESTVPDHEFMLSLSCIRVLLAYALKYGFGDEKGFNENMDASQKAVEALPEVEKESFRQFIDSVSENV